MRSKEEAHDYRYFPDPDLLPLRLDASQLEEVRSSLPELPSQKVKRYQEVLGLPLYDAEVLTAEREMAEYFEIVAEVSEAPKASANWVMTELMRELNQNQRSVSQSPVKAQQLGKLVRLVESKSISGKIGKTVFQEMWASGKEPDQIIKEKGLVQITDESVIMSWIQEIMDKNPQAVVDYRAGKSKLFGFFVGELMKLSKGKASPELANQLLQKELGKKN
jgi:aspartyl-tRNA(Asn)/glutamyl-tRNA(Gln) amidotransferase subunit B